MVGTASVRDSGQGALDGSDAFWRGLGTHQRARLLSQPATLLDHVEPEHAHSRSDQQAHDQLANEAKTDHAGGLPELGFGSAHPVHGDRADGREGGMLRLDAIGNGDAEVHWNPVELSVQGVLVACGRHELADPELPGTAAHLDDYPAQGVAERCIRVQSAHDLLVGRDRALQGHRVEYLAHLVWPCSGLADHGQLRLGQLHHLGAGGNERVQRADEHAPGTADRSRDIEDNELPGLVILSYLLHCVLCPSRRNAHGLRVPVPQLQCQQLPDLLGAVLAAVAIRTDEARERVAANHPGLYQFTLHEYVVDNLPQLASEQGTKLSRVIEGVGAADRWALREVREGQEALPRAGVPRAPAHRRRRLPVHDRSHAPADAVRQPAVLAGQQAREVPAITTEQLVGTHAGENDLHAPLMRGLAHQQGVDGGWISDWLIEHVNDPREQVNSLRTDLDLVQPNPELRSDLSRVHRVVRHRLEPLILLPKGDRVRIDRRVRLVREHGNDARVEPARQEA